MGCFPGEMLRSRSQHVASRPSVLVSVVSPGTSLRPRCLLVDINIVTPDCPLSPSTSLPSRLDTSQPGQSKGQLWEVIGRLPQRDRLLRSPSCLAPT